MDETKIGTVTHYYNHLHVAGVAITDGELHKGDTIHVKGNTSDFEQKVESMESTIQSARSIYTAIWLNTSSVTTVASSVMETVQLQQFRQRTESAYGIGSQFQKAHQPSLFN